GGVRVWVNSVPGTRSVPTSDLRVKIRAFSSRDFARSTCLHWVLPIAAFPSVRQRHESFRLLCRSMPSIPEKGGHDPTPVRARLIATIQRNSWTDREPDTNIASCQNAGF